MIGRIWRGWTRPENADAYEVLLRTTVLPGIAAKQIDGYRGAHLMRRDAAPEVEFVTVLWFDSLDVVRAFTGPDYAVAYVPEAAQALLERWDARSVHYDVILEPRETGGTP